MGRGEWVGGEERGEEGGHNTVSHFSNPESHSRMSKQHVQVYVHFVHTHVVYTYMYTFICV